MAHRSRNLLTEWQRVEFSWGCITPSFYTTGNRALYSLFAFSLYHGTSERALWQSWRGWLHRKASSFATLSSRPPTKSRIVGVMVRCHCTALGEGHYSEQGEPVTSAPTPGIDPTPSDIGAQCSVRSPFITSRLCPHAHVHLRLLCVQRSFTHDRMDPMPKSCDTFSSCLLHASIIWLGLLNITS